jgi:hypothetical protein
VYNAELAFLCSTVWSVLRAPPLCPMSVPLCQEASPAAGEPARPDPAAPVRIAVAQMTATGDQAANLATCSRLAKVRESGGAVTLLRTR